jgi:hypothetical protein
MGKNIPYTEENVTLTEQMSEDIRNGKSESKQPDDVDIEWENDQKVIVDKETITKGKYVNFNTKKEIFL